MELTYGYHWFINYCKENDVPHDHILVKCELDIAKEYAEYMQWWKDQIRLCKLKKPKPDGHWLWTQVGEDMALKEMELDYQKANEKRIEHMINALEMAESVKDFDGNFNKFLEKEYTKTGLKIPKI